MWSIGDHVLAWWPGEIDWWYPGVVVGVEGDKVQVQYDDGDRAWVPSAEALAVEIAQGTRVHCRWQSGPEYFPGTVSARRGAAIYVQYDDGDEEWTIPSLARVHRSDLSA